MALLLWVPELRVYRGLSGIDSALFTMALLGLLRKAHAEQSRVHVILFWSVGFAFLAKLVFELTTGTAVFVDSLAFRPVPLAHVVGGVVGVGCAVAMPLRPGLVRSRG